MFSKSTFFPIICLLTATTSFAVPVAKPRDMCVVLPSGKYTISLAGNDWELVPYHHSMAPPGITTQQTPPIGNYGVWEISPAPQNAYYMVNVGEGNVVSTLTLGGEPQPFTAYNVIPSPFAIQCAGNGLYVIKNPDADKLWTALPGAVVKLIGANGDISQRFKFSKV